MKKREPIPLIIIGSIIVLVPCLRCTMFFDSYLIKLWIAQLGTGILTVYFIYKTIFVKESFRLYGVTGFFLSAYLSVNLISWLLIPFPYKFPASAGLAALITYVPLCFYTSQYISGYNIPVILIVLWVITVFCICLYSIVQYFCGDLVIGTLGNPNFLASHIGISIPVCIGILLYLINKNNRNSFLKIILCMFITAVFFVALFLTCARGAWLGIFASLVCFTVIGWAPRNKRALIIASLVFLIILLGCTSWGIKFLTEQFRGDVRVPIWKATINMIAEKPLLGWGKGAYFIFYPQYRLQEYWSVRCPTDLTIHAHNEYLQICAETGIAGLFIFMAMIYFVLRSGIEKFDETKHPGRYLLLGIISAIIGLLTHNLVCNNLQMPSSGIYLWLMLGFVMSCGKSNVYVPGINRYFGYSLFILVLIIFGNLFFKQIAAQYYFKKGIRYRQKENWQDAIKGYNKALILNPWDVEMHYRTAYAYSMAGDDDKAIEEYKKVISLAPLYGMAHRNLGIIYMKKDKYNEAVKSFSRQLCINESDLIAKSNLVKIWEGKEEKNE